MSETRLVAVLGLLAVSCLERPPPPGSGAIETTPTASASTRVPLSAAPVGPRALPCPNGSVVTTDGRSCRLALLRDGTVRWDRELAGCSGILEAAAAADSSVFVRTPKALVALTPEGAEKWSAKMDDPSVPRGLATPTTLADSRAAVLTSKKSLVVYDHDGKISWTFSPPSDEEVTSSPEGMKTEGVLVATSQATYYLGSGGEIRWRVANKSGSAASP